VEFESNRTILIKVTIERTFEPGIFQKCYAGLPEKEAEDTKGRN
jgi:hypothetical protein